MVSVWIYTKCAVSTVCTVFNNSNFKLDEASYFPGYTYYLCLSTNMHNVCKYLKQFATISSALNIVNFRKFNILHRRAGNIQVHLVVLFFFIIKCIGLFSTKLRIPWTYLIVKVSIYVGEGKMHKPPRSLCEVGTDTHFQRAEI